MNPNCEEGLYAMALDKPAVERNAVLKVVCDHNEPPHQRLEGLLAANEQPEAALATAAPAVKATMKVEFAGESKDEAVGQTLGRYKILERVGEGGCGVVYVAEQTEPVPAGAWFRNSVAKVTGLIRQLSYSGPAHLGLTCR